MNIEICRKDTALALAGETDISTSVISISSPEEADPEFPDNPKLISVLFLHFNDLFREYDEEGFPYGRPLPKREDFRGLKEFVSSLSCERLLIHCFEGTSRSAAVAAAVYAFRGYTDDLLSRQPFAPNPLVYSLVCEELGIPERSLHVSLQDEDGFFRIRLDASSSRRTERM